MQAIIVEYHYGFIVEKCHIVEKFSHVEHINSIFTNIFGEVISQDIERRIYIKRVCLGVALSCSFKTFGAAKQWALNNNIEILDYKPHQVVK